MQLWDLNGKLALGYRMMNMPGIAPSRRGTLYYRLFSGKEDFLIESRAT
jgi:hypothetical protein